MVLVEDLSVRCIDGSRTLPDQLRVFSDKSFSRQEARDMHRSCLLQNLSEFPQNLAETLCRWALPTGVQARLRQPEAQCTISSNNKANTKYTCRFIK